MTVVELLVETRIFGKRDGQTWICEAARSFGRKDSEGTWAWEQASNTPLYSLPLHTFLCYFYVVSVLRGLIAFITQLFSSRPIRYAS